MNTKISKQDKHILESFIENKIPEYIKFQIDSELDLMEYYEELFNYSHNLLVANEIDVSINSIGTGKAFIFNNQYKNILFDLANSNDDIDLKIHCYLSLTTLSILQKYAKQK